MDPKVQQLINELTGQVGNASFSAYEDPTKQFEVATYEQFLVKSGVDAFNAKRTALAAASSPQLANQLQTAMNKSGQGLLGLDETIAAQFNIIVTRPTAAIALDLPFAVFGKIASLNGYRQALNGMIPAGVVLTSVEIGEVDGQPNAALFTYTQGANVDTILVEADTYPYPSLLDSTVTDTMRLSKIRMELSDETQARQFRQRISTDVANMFGRSNGNSMNATSFRAPTDFQRGIVDIQARVDIDKETSLISKIINVAAFSVTWAMFVSRFDRRTSKGLGLA